MLGGVGLALLFDLSLLLLNLAADLFLNLRGSLALLNKLLVHQGGLFIDLFFEFLVLALQVFVFLLDLINRFLVLLVFIV